MKGILYMISYNPLWKTLIDKDMKKMDLVKLVGISNGTLAKLGKNESVSLSIIDKICMSLDCNISDIVEIKKNSE
nr:helix-turn-helix domain-containing protein [Terrisporobacter petrolearius]